MGSSPGFKHTASKDWKGKQFFSISLIVTTLSIIFFFAGRHFLHKLDLYSPVSSGGVQKTGWIGAWTGIGGTVVNEVRVQIDGPQNVGASKSFHRQTEKLLSGVQGQPILMLSVRDVERELLRLPWIESVSVRKQFPSTLEVVVDERQPVFAVRAKDSWALADEDGQVIFVSPALSGAFAHLPRVLGLEGRLVGDIEEMNRALTFEKSWLQDLSLLIRDLSLKTGLTWSEVKIEEEPWMSGAVYHLTAVEQPWKLSLSHQEWQGRLSYLQYILSDLQDELSGSEELVYIEGQYPHKWYVGKGDLGG